ncbi:MAG: DUF4445 domain-containing protein [Deltaproteobacteria bacterium]|nr:DUF4445 domain-containing protein [Deltaproteobacteria bacterium]
MREDADNKGRVGAAFDIGTTTIAAASVDMGSGRVLVEKSLPNPQAGWGRDVVSRINAAEDPSVLAALSKSVREACGGLIEEFTGGKDPALITIAGNPVMEHLFLGVSPVTLSRPPYRPEFKTARTISAKEAGLAFNAPLYVFPLIGGFVGGDAVAVVLSIGLHKSPVAALAMDIGTNSEIMLSANGIVYATSAAAGPAFEGGEIEYGMVADRGAIRGVRVEGDRVSLDIIGEVAPKGICGSGLIEAASALIKAGVIERTGRIRDRDEVEDNLSGRIREGKDGNSFVLYKGPGREITLTQSDIRALQTAKAAIRAGVSILLKKSGLKPGNIKKVYVAGAFGANLREEGLSTIGILEKDWLGKVEFAGDAALSGAVLALQDDRRAEAEEIAISARYVPLSGSAHFEREFLRNMDF